MNYKGDGHFFLIMVFTIFDLLLEPTKTHNSAIIVPDLFLIEIPQILRRQHSERQRKPAIGDRRHVFSK